jgi:hypothetical protein
MGFYVDLHLKTIGILFLRRLLNNLTFHGNEVKFYAEYTRMVIVTDTACFLVTAFVRFKENRFKFGV